MATNVSFFALRVGIPHYDSCFKKRLQLFLKTCQFFSTQACASTALVVFGIYALVPNCALGVIYVKDFAMELKVICIMLPI